MRHGFISSLSTLWDVIHAVEALVDVHGVVDHVGLAEEVDLRLENLVIWVELFLLQKLQKGKHQMTIQMGSNLRRQIILCH